MSALSKRALPVFGLATVLILVLFALAVPPARAASIVVNSAADTTVAGDGACTLREAINNANSDSDTTSGDCTAGSGADDITFTANTTITLGGTQLPTVTTEMTITGNGAANTIIEAQTCNPVTTPGVCTPIESRVFELNGGNLTLDGVTVRHGHCFTVCGVSLPNFGGGILNLGGTLAMTNSTISGNSAEIGGGIMDLGTLTVTNSTISGNSATDGGGIFANSTLTLTDSTLSGNSADSGGGLYGFAMTVTNSNLSGNSAQLAGGGIYSGGALDVTTSTLLGNMTDGDGGGIRSAGTFTLTDSTLSGNSAERGGGIFTTTNSANTTVTNSTLSSNSADIAGGAVYNEIGVMTLTGSTLSGNSAERGGGIYNDTNGTSTTVTNSTLSGNTAERDGGGIYNNIGLTTVTNSTLFGNMADDGGGIYTAFNAGFAGTTTLVRSLIAGNSASTADEIQHLAGVPLNANAYSVFGHSGLTNADAFSGFTPSGTDVTATSDGTNPTALASILDPALQNNGGTTDTHALVSGSPAIDLDTVGDCTAAPVNGVDQRGETRPQGAGCDAGAYETAGSVTPTTGTIYIVKDDTSDSDTSFSFNENINEVGFSLQDPSDDTEEFLDVDPGSYDVIESVPQGWTLDSIVCEEDGTENSSGDTQTETATINLEAGETVTCTFTNSPAATTGTIEIVKVANPADPYDFSFNLYHYQPDFGLEDTFLLDDDDDENNALPSKATYTLDAGIDYAVSEAAGPGGWVLSSIVCTSTDTSRVYPESSYDPNNDGYGIRLDNLMAAEVITCTFTNTQCQPGTYDNGGRSCVPADPGNFVAEAEATEQTQCEPGRWQDQAGAVECKLADPGFYVPEPGATEQIECEEGFTSEAGATECYPIEAGNTCPVEYEEGGVNIFRTTIYGTGMGSLNRARTQAKLTIPNAGDTTALYGQMAARTFSGVRFVRFMYPRGKDGYVQVQPETDLGVDKAISWWGAPLDETLLSRPYIKGRWFLLKGARKFKLQRAFVVYATQQVEGEYASNWTTFTSPNNFVAPTAAFPQEVTNTLGIPETQATTDLTVQVALVDINVDDRTVDVTVRAGGVEVTQTIMKPDSRKMDLLNIETFILPGVPAGVDEIEIVVETALDEGDSAGLLGASAWYECVDVEGPEPEPDR